MIFVRTAEEHSRQPPKVPAHIDWMLAMGLGIWIILALLSILDTVGAL